MSLRRSGALEQSPNNMRLLTALAYGASVVGKSTLLAMTYAVLRFFFHLFNCSIKQASDSQHHLFTRGAAVFEKAFG